MATAFTQKLGAATSIPITATTLASSATVGRQSDAVTFLDANGNVPEVVDVELAVTIANTTPANDKAAYLFMARSIDGTNFDTGMPAVGASDAAFTFASSPVGTAPLPTDFLFVGAITMNAALDARRKNFRIAAPPHKAVFLVLNYTGAAFTACSLQYRSRTGDGR